MRVVAVFLLVMLPAAGLLAQSHEHAAAEKPATLMPGMGTLHHPIATTNPEAQKFFDQGLTLMYGFNHAEAIRSFTRASQLDPKAVMPLWGIALALGPNYNLDVDPAAEKAAFEAGQKALAASVNAPENERAYVQAVVARYTDDPKADLKKLGVAYKDAMKALHEKYPDDLDAATLYAESLMVLNPWRLWSSDGKPADGTMEIVSVLQSVLSRDPQHVGANHYLVHALEASPNPEQAAGSAKALETLVPNAGHLVHMPAHIYMRTGDYAGASKANAAAAKVDEAYIQSTGVQGVYPMMYYNHNLHFLAASSMMEGIYTTGAESSKKMAAGAAPMVKEMPMIEPFLLMPWFVDLRFQKWDHVLAVPAPDPAMILTTAFWHYARALAYLGTGKLDLAEKERASMAEWAAKIPADAMWSFNKTTDVSNVGLDVLAARIAWAKKDSKGAIELWRKAVAAEDALGYDEPPDWYYPARESLGAALYMDGQYAEAEAVFREDLRRNPRNGRSLFGLMESLKAQKKTDDAVYVQEQFEAAWKNAEVKLKISDF